MADNIIRIAVVAETEAAQAKFKELGQIAKASGLGFTDLRRGLIASDKVINDAGKVVDRFTTKSKEMNQVLKASAQQARAFRFEFLGILFGAQVIQRQLSRLSTQAVTTFSDIAGEANPANQALAAFGANITFIRFSLGRAIAEGLLPFLPIFVDVSEAIVDFIDQHPEEVFSALAIALGTAVAGTIVAQWALLASSISNLASNAGGIAQLTKNLGALGVRGAGITIGVAGIYQGIQDAEGNPIKSAGDFLLGIGGIQLALGKTGKGPIGFISLGLQLQFLADPALAGKVIGFLFNIILTIARVTTEVIAGIIEAITTLDISKLTEPLADNFADFGEKFQEGFQPQISEENRDFFDKLFGRPEDVQKRFNDIEQGFGRFDVAAFNSQLGIRDFGAEFRATGDSTVMQVDRISQALNLIPTEITTTHYIRTVYV